MQQTVQLSIADREYAAAVREALGRSCAWEIETVDVPDPSRHCGMVLDEVAFQRLQAPVFNPERVVLIIRKRPDLLAEAWNAGIVSIVGDQDPINTVLLAILAAGLRVDKSPSAISPKHGAVSAPKS